MPVTRILLASLACLLCSVPAASAATLDFDVATKEFRYTATAGEVNSLFVNDPSGTQVRFDEGGPVTIALTSTASDPAGGACTLADGNTQATCTRTGVNGIEIDLLDMNDNLASISVLPIDADGGTGGDALSLQGPGNDVVDGGAGTDAISVTDGADVVRGGSGDDFITLGQGGIITVPGADGDGDDVHGGTGIDTVTYVGGAAALNVSLDNQANDGPAGEPDNIRSDVEDIRQEVPFIVGTIAASNTNDTYTGSAASNLIVAGAGGDQIDPGPGSDVVEGRSGNDTITTRDGWPDRVFCQDGDADVAVVDQFDTVSDTCETVNLAQVPSALDVPGAPEDAPPTVAWVSPASREDISTAQPNVLQVAATDDKGVARVVFISGETVLCTDTAAPFTCAYSPTDADVGRATLTAVAFDAAGQSASANRVVSVPRFNPQALTATSRPKRDARAPYTFTTTGSLRLPPGVTEARGCSGTVAVQFKAGKKTVSTRRVNLSSRCTYRAKVTFRLPSRLRPKTLRVFVSYRGNSVLLPREASRYTVRTR